jgi:hypothetical protein
MCFAGGLGWGGVDGAISFAGGKALLQARRTLPLLEGGATHMLFYFNIGVDI